MHNMMWHRMHATSAQELKEVAHMCQLDYVPQEERSHAKELLT